MAGALLRYLLHSYRYAYVQNPVPPKNSPTLREAMHMAASLGGFLGRKNDGEPGTKSLWLNLQRLEDMTAMWKMTMSTASIQ